MRTIEEVIAELRKDIHSDVYLGKKTIGTYLDEILEIHNTEKTHWTPVGEGLPKKGYSVWVTRITDDNCKYATIASYQGDCWMDNTDEFNKPNPDKVIAWQPITLF